MGRRLFSPTEADEIRRLLRVKSVADRDRQKALRAQLRGRLDFYISDFTDRADGFTASDFDELVANGAIEISGERGSKTQPESESTTRLTIAKDEAEDHVLPDVLEPGLRVVFCGTAVGAKSALVRAYYAGRGNQFWDVLARAGLTPRVVAPHEFRELTKYSIGLTDLAKRASGGDTDIATSEFDVDATQEKIEKFAPALLAFNGKRAGKAFLGRPVDYGRQRESIGATALFVLPSTSGAARGHWDDSHWFELAELCDAAIVP